MTRFLEEFAFGSHLHMPKIEHIESGNDDLC